MLIVGNVVPFSTIFKVFSKNATYFNCTTSMWLTRHLKSSSFSSSSMAIVVNQYIYSSFRTISFVEIWESGKSEQKKVGWWILMQYNLVLFFRTLIARLFEINQSISMLTVIFFSNFGIPTLAVQPIQMVSNFSHFVLFCTHWYHILYFSGSFSTNYSNPNQNVTRISVISVKRPSKFSII